MTIYCQACEPQLLKLHMKEFINMFTTTNPKINNQRTVEYCSSSCTITKYILLSKYQNISKKNYTKVPFFYFLLTS